MQTVIQGAMTGLIDVALKWAAAPAEWAISLVTTAGAMRYLWGAAWAQLAIHIIQGIAGSVLAVRATWEALQIALVRSEGGPTDIGGLFRRVVMAVCAIVAGPTIAYQMLLAGNGLAVVVSHLGLATTLPPSAVSAFGGVTVGATGLLSVIVLLFGLILALVVFFQSVVRSIEMLLAALASPVLAVGFLADGGGTAAAWFVETLVLACTQSVQVLLMYVGIQFFVSIFTSGATPGSPGAFMDLCFFAGALWVAVKTPHILRQYTYHSGMGGGMVSIGGQAASAGVSAIMKGFGV